MPRDAVDCEEICLKSREQRDGVTERSYQEFDMMGIGCMQQGVIVGFCRQFWIVYNAG